MSRPKVRNSPASRRESPSPSSSPSVEPTSAIRNASTSTERVTCFLLAPRARSSADSRTRCETRIEKVLKMMQAPTTIAITAKVVRKIEMTSRNWPICSCVSLTTLSPVTAVKPSGTTASATSTSWVCETPSAPVSETLVKASCPSRKISCAAAVEVGRAHQGEGALRLGGGDDHRDGVADVVVPALGRRRVEGDLAGLLRPPPFVELEDLLALHVLAGGVV